jgi:hypothetical protein
MIPSPKCTCYVYIVNFYNLVNFKNPNYHFTWSSPPQQGCLTFSSRASVWQGSSCMLLPGSEAKVFTDGKWGILLSSLLSLHSAPCNNWAISTSMSPWHPRKIKSDKYVHTTQFSITLKLLVPVIQFHVWQTLISWRWAFLEKPQVVQLLKNVSAFYGTWRFISWATSIQSIPPQPSSPNQF